jgi:maltose/moltooligosaccharide transporter
MILQTVTFGYVLQHFLDNDPRRAISFGGVLLLIACAATLLIRPAEPVEENSSNIPSRVGG